MLLRDAFGGVQGGLRGAMIYDGLFVEVLWVAGEHQGAGHGSRLLAAAEAEALRRGGHAVHLDTFQFQARPFYEKHGYRVFGELPDYPAGQTRCYPWKPLAGTPGGRGRCRGRENGETTASRADAEACIRGYGSAPRTTPARPSRASPRT